MNVIMRQVEHDFQRGMTARDGDIHLDKDLSSDSLSKPDPATWLMMTMTWSSPADMENSINSIYRKVQGFHRSESTTNTFFSFMLDEV